MNLRPFPTAAALIQFHDAYLADAEVSQPLPGDPLWLEIARNHQFNCKLWAEEDLARRRDVEDHAIAANKRAIDGFNQSRNDAIERIDEIILSALAAVPRLPHCRLNSETAGSMADRLSIVSLKIHHMRIQTQRTEAGQEHLARCRERLERLTQQRADLARCFDELLRDCVAGSAEYHIYRQFKMYNDPALNPYLYRAPGAGDARSGSA